MNGKTSHTCPDNELLSAWLDGEYTADGEFAEHIADCPDCRKKLDAYAAIGAGLARSLTAEPPTGLESGILAHIRTAESDRKAAASEVSGFRARLPWIMRIAALILMAAFFLYLVMDRHETHKTGRTQTAIAANANTNFSAEPEQALPPAYSVLGAPKNNLIRTVGTASDGHTGAVALDVDPLLMPMTIFPISSFELNPPESPELIRKEFDLSDAITAGELYPQLRNALASLDVPNVSFAVRRKNDLVTALVEIRSASRLSLVRHNNTLEFRITQADSGTAQQASSVRYELGFLCKPAQ